MVESGDSVTTPMTQVSLQPEYENKKVVIVIGISGGSGSGKSTLSAAVCDSLGRENITTLCHDSYYRDLSFISQHEWLNHDHPSSLETNLLVNHIKELKDGCSVDVPVYDFVTRTRQAETNRMDPKPIILVEGIMILHEQALCDLIDIKVWVDTPSDIRFIRRLQRDIIHRERSVECVINQYLTQTRPMHKLYAEKTRRKADIILPDGVNTVVLDMIVSRLQSHISRPV